MSTTTTRLALVKQDVGENPGTWGTVLNGGLQAADDRLFLTGAANPNVATQADYLFQRYYDSVGDNWFTAQDTAGPASTWLLGNILNARLDATNVFAAENTHEADIVLNNVIALEGKEVGGTPRNIAQVSASDEVVLGNTTIGTRILSAGASPLLANEGAGDKLIWHAGNTIGATSHGLGLGAATFKEVLSRALTPGTVSTTAHGLGVVPALVICTIRCILATNGWGLDEEGILASTVGSDGLNGGIRVSWDATNIYSAINGTAFQIMGGSGSVTFFTPTNTNFKIDVRAWA
jgi:hypothetical protein